MIITSNQLVKQLNDYVNPYGRIARMVRDGKLFPLTKGIYETDQRVSGLCLAGSIYGPSYISFNSALSFYGLIPEGVYTYTSATTQKLKKKEYKNSFGTFTYRDVPTDVFYYAINVVERDGYMFMIATKEKALCDKLYDSEVVRSVKDLKKLLFEDMRIDENVFETLDRNDIYFLVPKYRSTNLNVFVKYLRSRYHE